MPLWSNPTEGQGVLPAQVPFPGPAAIDPRLINSILQQQQAHSIGAVGQQVVQGLQGVLAQRQNDRIANTLLAAQATGQPATVQQLQGASRLGLFGGPEVQDLGGTQAYGMYQKQLGDFQKQQLNQAHIDYYNALSGKADRSGGTGGAGGGTPALTVDPTTGFIWNGRQWVKPAGGMKAAPTAASKTSAELGKYGLTPEDLDNLDIAKTDIIPPKGNAGQKASIVTQDGRQATIPWDAWQRIANIKKQGGFSAAQTGGAAPDTAGAGNTAALSQANQIKSDFQAGKLTADEARAKLSALGIFE